MCVRYCHYVENYFAEIFHKIFPIQLDMLAKFKRDWDFVYGLSK